MSKENFFVKMIREDFDGVVPEWVEEDFDGAAVAINDRGEILIKGYVGWLLDGRICNEDYKSFIYKPGERIELDFLGEDMNNNGEVVGEHYLWAKGETIDLIKDFNDYPPDVPFCDEDCKLKWEAKAINDNNQVAGTLLIGEEYGDCYDFDTSNMAAFCWREGRLTFLERPTYMSNGKLKYYDTYACDINNKNQIAGLMIRERDDHPILSRIWYACMWDEDGNITQLDTDYSLARAINDKEEIIGVSSKSFEDYYPQYAVLYKNGERIELDSCLPEEWSHLSMWDVAKINDNSQIIVWGHWYDGLYHGGTYLMTPISADLDKDEIVNFEDFAIMAGQWLEEKE